MDLPPPVPQPCNDCPWRKNATPGWLGPHSAKQWVRMAHGETPIACHETIKFDGSWEGAKQCAGAASFRANVAKRPRDPAVALGPRREDVFETTEDFVEYHTEGQQTWEPTDMWVSDE